MRNTIPAKQNVVFLAIWSSSHKFWSAMEIYCLIDVKSEEKESAPDSVIDYTID